MSDSQEFCAMSIALQNLAQHTSDQRELLHDYLWSTDSPLVTAVGELTEAVRALKPAEVACTCGSGGHPRDCLKHPQGKALHVMTLNYESASAEVSQLEARNESLLVENSDMAVELERLRAENLELKTHLTDETCRAELRAFSMREPEVQAQLAELKRFREREEKLKTLLDGIPRAIAVLRDDGLTRTASDFEAAYAAVCDFKVTP